MDPALWMAEADNLTKTLGNLAKARSVRLEQERLRRQTEIRGTLDRLLSLLPVREAPNGDEVVRRGDRIGIARRAMNAVRSIISKTWRRFVAKRRKGRTGTTRVQPVLSDHEQAARAASSFLRKVGLKPPTKAQLRNISRSAVRDMSWNVRKLIEREALSAGELVTRAAAGGDRIADVRKAVAVWGIRKDVWNLALGSHVYEAARAALASTDADKFVVMVPRAMLKNVKPGGTTGKYLYGVFTRKELDELFKKINSQRAPRHRSSWRTLGFHHGSFEVYVPVPDEVDTEGLGSLLQARRIEWRKNVETEAS